MEKVEIRKKIRSIVFIISFIILFFEEKIVKHISYFKYYDEILTVILFIRFIIILFQNKGAFDKIDKNELFILIGVLFIIIIGIISNYFSNFQSIKYILIDLFSSIEIFLLYCSLKHFSIDTNMVMKVLMNFSKIMVIIIFFCGILNLFVDIGMEYEIRYGIKSYKFIFANPGTLVIVLVSMTAILDTKFKKNILYIVFAIISILLTLRGLGIGIAIIYIVMKVLLYKKYNIKIRNMFIILVLMLIIGNKQILMYYYQDTPRNALLINGVKIANDYFPLGTGFGTYGSDVTKESYTDLYYIYGLNKYYGLSEDLPGFITDGYWPMIFAQFGWIGSIITIIVLLLIYKDIKNKINKINCGGIYTILIYIVISTAATQLLSHYLGVLLFLIIELLMQLKESNFKEGDKNY